MELSNYNVSVRGMKGLLILGEISLLCWLAVTEGMSEVGIFLLAMSGAIVLALAITRNWPVGATAVLLVASAMPRFAGTISKLHLRPEHVAVAFVGFAIWVQMLRHRIPWKIELRRFDYFLLAYVALNFFTSAFTSTEPRMTLRWAVLNAIITAPFFLLRFLLTDLRSIYKAVQIFLLVGFLEAAYGVTCFLSHMLFHTKFGVEAEQYGFIPATYGSQYEANIFGSYVACCAIAFLAFFLFGRDSDRTKYGLGLGITLFGAVVSMARSVLLALPVAGFFVLYAAFKSGQLRMRSLVRLTAGSIALLILISPLMLHFIVERFSTIDLTDLSSDSTTVMRVVQLAAGLENVRAHPILGTGTASFQLLFDWDDYMPGMGGDKDEGGWLGNTPLRILHDTGIVGLAIFIGFIYSLMAAVRRAFREANHELKKVLIALSGGLILYAITFQATEATILAFTWIHFGLLAAVASIAQARKADQSGSLHVQR